MKISKNKSQAAGKINFLLAVFLQKSSGETFREKRVCCQFVVKMLSKPEMSTNFRGINKSKIRKKPDFSGIFLVAAKDLIEYAKTHLPILLGTQVIIPRTRIPREVHRIH